MTLYIALCHGVTFTVYALIRIYIFSARVIQKATYQGRLIYETTAEYLKHIL
jgi:hypothetical protein